jgi:hypothetical protein
LGSFVVRESFRYANQREWRLDYARHCVDPGDPSWGWWDGPGGEVYGWRVKQVVQYPTPRPAQLLTRMFRSLYRTVNPTENPPTGEAPTEKVPFKALTNGQPENPSRAKKDEFVEVVRQQTPVPDHARGLGKA